MKTIKNFNQFIREFVENSNISLDDLKKAKYNIELLIETINEEFLLDEDSEEEIRETYNELLDITVFNDLYMIINQFFNKKTSMANLYDALQQASHLLKDIIEQYNMQGVTYSHKEIDSTIDSFVNDLNSILPFALNKITRNDFIEKETQIIESIKNRK